jgi:hypothetical protein
MAYTTINKSTDNFNTKLYTGNGSTNAITGVGFAPDLVWQKRRDGVNGHVLFDNVRGATKIIQSDATSANITSNSGKDTVSLDSDGFTVAVPEQTGGININGSTCVAWNWLAGGTGSSNTDGSITSTVSANTTAGFSIVKYTGTGANATVGHGLGVAPKMILFKDTTTAGTNWSVYHKSIGNDYRLTLNTTAARQGTDSTYYQSTDPSSSLIYLGSNTRANASGAVTIAYCFAEKQGYSKFGSYTGTASTDGPMIFTGFKPAFFLFKRFDAIKDWHIIDSTRDIDNPTQTILYPNANFAEGTPTAVDFVSNGIKIRNGGSFVNEVNGTYIYMAIGQSIVGSNNVPATAR